MALGELIAEVIRREGGFIDHPADRGGATKYGITRQTLAAWRGRAVAVRDIQTLTTAEATDIYSARYYHGAKLDGLPEFLQACMFDACVNHGARNAWKLLQRAVNELGVASLAEDGIPGQETFSAVEATCLHHGPQLLQGFVNERRKFYEAIALHDPAQRVFLKGWLARMEEFV